MEAACTNTHTLGPQPEYVGAEREASYTARTSGGSRASHKNHGFGLKLSRAGKSKTHESELRATHTAHDEDLKERTLNLLSYPHRGDEKQAVSSCYSQHQ